MRKHVKSPVSLYSCLRLNTMFTCIETYNAGIENL